MTFAIREESRALGEPINLYLFRYGDEANSYFAYTDAEASITHNGITFEPAPVDRDSVKSSGNLDKASLSVRLPQDLPAMQFFRQYPPAAIITLTIWQGHQADPEFLVVWTGRVLGSSIEGNEAVLNCEPISTSFRRTMLRRHYQYGCPHALYGPGCGANKAAATITRNVQTVNGPRVTLPSNWETSERRQKYVGGTLEWTLPDGRKDLRTIIRIDGAELLLSSSVSGLLPGQAVQVVLGCNHQMDDCADLHGNINNFGGQPWIPTKNPFGIVNNFY